MPDALAPWWPVVITALISAVATAVMSNTLGGALNRQVMKKLDDFDRKREDARAVSERRSAAMERGIRSLLRAELVRAHTKWVPRGYCPLETKEYVSRTYDAYHGLGGNDIGTAMYRDVMELPVERHE